MFILIRMFEALKYLSLSKTNRFNIYPPLSEMKPFFTPEYQCNALWIIWAIKNQLLVQKSCSNFTFLTLPTTKALILRNKSHVQVWNYNLDLWKYSIFCEIFGFGLPEIADLGRIAKDRAATASEPPLTFRESS